MSCQPFRFLDLPPEIREKIYIQISQSSIPILLNAPYAHTSFPHALLLTNAQIYHELRPLYFAINTFAITLLRRNEVWNYILSPSFLDNRRQIRSLRVNIVRWGSKDFFVEQLVPVLEDCIMNGRLRDLEVRVRDVGFEGGNGMKMGKGEQGANWVALMGLLRDPYLERRVLMAGPIVGKRDIHPAVIPDLMMPFRYPKLLFSFEEKGRWCKLDEMKLSEYGTQNTT